ncbi:MAG: hypothetical protein ACRD1K_09960, partial [Acidimicrobiales bacterium]
WALGVAAAGALVLGAGSVLVSLNGDTGGGSDLAAAPTATDGAAPSPEAQRSAAPYDAGGALGAPNADTSTESREAADLGFADLGDLTDLAAVAAIVAGSAGGASGPAAAAPALPAAPPVETGPAAPTSVSAAGLPPCATEAAAAAGPARAATGYVAVLRFRQVPAVVHTFTPTVPAADGRASRRVVVIASAGCEVLGVADF